MIPPRLLPVYPPNTLEGMIARKWIQMITECEDHTINPEPISDVIAKTQQTMRAAGWPPTYQHTFLKRLRNDLTVLTECHPVTRQFVEILGKELECN